MYSLIINKTHWQERNKSLRFNDFESRYYSIKQMFNSLQHNSSHTNYVLKQKAIECKVSDALENQSIWTLQIKQLFFVGLECDYSY